MRLSFLLVIAAIGSSLCYGQWRQWTPETGWTNDRYDPRAQAQVLYQEAKKLIEAKNYLDAIARLEKIAESYPYTLEGKDSLYLIGKCLYALGNYYESYQYYEKYRLAYPTTPHMQEILKKEYDIGCILIEGKEYLFAMHLENQQSLEQGQIGQDVRRTFAGSDCPLSPDAAVETAIEGQKWKVVDGEQQYLVVRAKDEIQVYREEQKRGALTVLSADSAAYGAEILKKLLEISPHAEFADDAQLTIANYYFKEEDYLEAQNSYHSLLEQYPKSAWCPLAQYQMALCSALQYQGPSYERQPLLVAEKKLKEYEKKYQDTADTQLTQKVKMLLAQIQDKQARKELMVADYYLSQGEISSAKIYLYTIIQTFPNTPTAKEAKELLQRLKSDR